MCDIRLDDVDTASLEVRSAVKTCEQSLSELKGELGSLKKLD
jgi:hypothetical protein